MTTITVLGIDLAKTCFELYGVNCIGEKVLSTTTSRDKVVDAVVKRRPDLVAMEACGGAHHLARRLRQAGLAVRLIAPQYVKRFRLGPSKDDRADAKAIVIAARQAEIPTVAVKELWQQDIQFIHRIREDLVSRRTALCNQYRGFLYECGFIAPQGIKDLLELVATLVGAAHDDVPPQLQRWLGRFRDQYTALEAEIEMVTAEIERTAVSNEICKRLTTVPGIGPITATALVAYSGDGSTYRNGRQFAASLGLVPRHTGSGGKNTNLGITKHGDRYLRCMLVHGGRALTSLAKRRPDRGQQMAARLLATNKPSAKVAVALANRNARIAWRIIAKGETYDPRRA